MPHSTLLRVAVGFLLTTIAFSLLQSSIRAACNKNEGLYYSNSCTTRADNDCASQDPCVHCQVVECANVIGSNCADPNKWNGDWQDPWRNRVDTCVPYSEQCYGSPGNNCPCGH